MISPGPWQWGYQNEEGHTFDGDLLLDADGHTVGVQQRDYDRQKQHKISTFAPNMAAIAKIPGMISWLRTLEWDWDSEWRLFSCPTCGAEKSSGHSPACELGKFLADLPEVP